MQVDFYQIGEAGLEQVVLMLVKKTLAENQKALVLCPMPAAGAIDTALWSHDPESWIPHGLDDANGVDYCHVWVSSDMAANPINAKYLFLLHGSVPAQWNGFTRCFCLFDGILGKGKENHYSDVMFHGFGWFVWPGLPEKSQISKAEI